MASYVLAIDQGTTGSAAAVMDETGVLRSKVKREYRQIFPRPGWVEHDPEDIWRTVLEAASNALGNAGIKAAQIAAIGIANQRETTLIWDRQTGAPIHNAVVWQDRRTADFCAKLKAAGHERQFRSKSGLLLDPYFSGTKIRWLLDHVAGLRAQAKSGAVAFGTVDSFLLWRLSSGAVHATDVSNASRTLLMNLKTLGWDESLCGILGVPRAVLPEIRPNIGVLGRTKGAGVLPDGIPIAAMAGDQQAALFGQACFKPGSAKCTFGTGSFLLINAGAKVPAPIPGCVATVAWNWAGKTVYALEGSAFVCGAAVQWLRDGLGIIASSGDIEALARSVPDSDGVQFVPALTGLGAPHWRPEARGLISGLSRGSTKAHLARAALEGMALQNAELLAAMENGLKRRINCLKVDGGAAANDLLLQLQADYSGIPCVRPDEIETTAAGAAFMAGLGIEMWKTTDEIAKAWRQQKEFLPTCSSKERAQRLRLWREAVHKA